MTTVITLAQATGGTSTFTTAALLISALFGGGVLAAVVQWLANRGKASAEEAETWTRISSSRLQAVSAEMEKLEVKVKALNTELERERAERIRRDIDLQYAVHLLLAHDIEWSPPSAATPQ